MDVKTPSLSLPLPPGIQIVSSNGAGTGTAHPKLPPPTGSSAAPTTGRLPDLRDDNPAVRPTRNNRAAVLVGLFELDGIVWVLLTQRTGTLRSHAGEVSLPGGKRDPTDVNDIMTALRESNEEIGLRSTDSSISVLTTLPSIFSKNMLAVRPVLARIPIPAFMLTPGVSHSHGAAVAGTGVVPISAKVRTLKPTAIAASALRYSSLAAHPTTNSATAAANLATPPSPAYYFLPSPSIDEVDNIFAVPLGIFLYHSDTSSRYTYQDIEWQGGDFRIHRFHYNTDRYWTTDQCLLALQSSAAPDRSLGATSNLETMRRVAAHAALRNEPREFLVWGMTAYVLIAAAALFYGRPPSFPFATRPGESDQAGSSTDGAPPKSAPLAKSKSSTTKSTTSVTHATPSSQSHQQSTPATAAAAADPLEQFALDAERRIRSGPIMNATNDQLRVLLNQPTPTDSVTSPSAAGGAEKKSKPSASAPRSKL